METAAAAMAVTVIPVEIPTPEDLDPVFSAGERTGGRRHRAAGPAVFHSEANITAAALATRLRTIHAFRAPVDDGGLISYGIDISQNFRRADDYVGGYRYARRAYRRGYYYGYPYY